jgi:tetratricopeptide (TPR) repeat protein
MEETKMKIRMSFSGLITAVFLLPLVNNIYPQSLEELLKKGDDYISINFDNQKALEVYKQADTKFPNNWEVFWRLSRAYVYEAEKMPDKTGEQKDAQLSVYEKAFGYADNAVKLAPGEAVTYLRRAVANGRIALFKGVFSVAGVVNKVKADCDKAISLGSGGAYVQAVAHYVLARTNDKVSEQWSPARAVIGLGWANLDKAIEEYNTAIKIYPNFRMFYLDLGKAYLKQDEYAKAKEAFRKVIESPKKDENDDQELVEAKNLLEEIKNK